LSGLAARLARAAVVVGNSTGPVHLAAALGRPTLMLQAPWPSCGVARWGPYADNGWVLVAEHDAAMRWSRRQRARHHAGLMAAIPSRAVLDVALELSGVESCS
jgi:ADP-heptose:LPS heptosyltransferase